MYQAYAGKVLDGKPAILEDVTLPENTRLLLILPNPHAFVVIHGLAHAKV